MSKSYKAGIKSRNSKDKCVSIAVNEDLYSQLKFLAGLNNRTASNLIFTVMEQVCTNKDAQDYFQKLGLIRFNIKEEK